MENEESRKKESKERKKRVSLKQRQANRRNARRSTGPRTVAGKRRARWNALKHGLLAAEAVIPAGDGRELRPQFERLHRQLRRDLRPGNALEEMLVEKIAVFYWRLRRLLRYETGEIRKRLDTAASRPGEQPAAPHFSPAEAIGELFGLPPEDTAGACLHLEESSGGIRRLLGALQQVRGHLQTTGELSEPSKKQLVEYFGDDSDGLAGRCLLHNQGKDLPSLLQTLDEKQARLQQLLPKVRQREKMQREGHLARLSLPDKQAVERVVRYEANLERQLHRTLRELRRMQAERRKTAPDGAP